MTLDNDKKHLNCGLAVFKNNLSRLFLFVLLLFWVSNSHAQQTAEKKGWALKSKSIAQEETADDKIAHAEIDVEPQNDVTSNVEAQLSDSSDDVEGSGGSAERFAVSEQTQIVESSVAVENAESPVAETQDAANSELPKSAEPKAENTLARYDITQGAAPIDVPVVNVRPIVTLSPELRDSLERQFQQIQTLKETEDAYSEQLGESYLAYGRNLMQAGRIDESRKMLVNALHIAKINNGVNSIEQRPILRELFEMNLALGNSEETEDHLKRIIWLEKKQPQNDDIYSFDMVVRLGNYYLDLYLNNPVVSELSLSHLNKSVRFLGYAVSRYGDRPLSEVLLPFGELALAHHFKSRIQNDVDRTFYQDTRQRSFTDLDRQSRKPVRTNSFSRSERYLLDYLRKAKTERDLINTIQALLALGDINLMSDRINTAGKYYDLAWTGAQNLPVTHPLAESFNAPVKLPSFNFSVVRKPNASEREFEVVPMSINIDDDGKVRKVAREALIDTTVSTTTRARRIAKRIRFRPIIENGKLIPVSDYRYDVQVSVRKSKTVAAKDSAE